MRPLIEFYSEIPGDIQSESGLSCDYAVVLAASQQKPATKTSNKNQQQKLAAIQTAITLALLWLFMMSNQQGEQISKSATEAWWSEVKEWSWIDSRSQDSDFKM